jgi:isoleucyl-tRNA synthetase
LVVQADGRFTAALDPQLDEDLRREGLARELVNRIQRLRKDAGLDITDRISLSISGGDEVQDAAQAFEDFISAETLAKGYRVGQGEEPGRDGIMREVDLDGLSARIILTRAVD